jgi:hypothetical protein
MSEAPVPPGDAPVAPGNAPVEPQVLHEEDPMPGTLEAPAAETGWDQEVLPGRPRRRFLTPLTAVLFAALVGGAGFIAGVQVEKGQLPASGGGAGGARGARAGGGAGAAGGLGRAALGGGGAGGAGANAGGANATIGQVANVSGSVLYVTDLQGNTIKINASVAQVTKQVDATPTGIHPGDTVVAQGSKAPDGSVQATTIRDSGAGGAGAAAGLFGGGGTAGATGGGRAAGGGAGGGGGGQSLFGPPGG